MDKEKSSKVHSAYYLDANLVESVKITALAYSANPADVVDSALKEYLSKPEVRSAVESYANRMNDLLQQLHDNKK